MVAEKRITREGDGLVLEPWVVYIIEIAWYDTDRQYLP